MVENQRFFQGHQRKPGFPDALFRPPVRHRQPGGDHKIGAVLGHAVENGLVIARFHDVGGHQQIDADFYRLLPGFRFRLQADGVVLRQRFMKFHGRSLFHVLREVSFNHLQQLGTEIRWRKHVTHAHHMFITGDGNLPRDMG